MESQSPLPPKDVGETVEDSNLIPPPTEASQTVEKTEEQKKVEAIFNRVNEVNQQLDGGVAHQIPMKDGSTTLLFSVAAGEKSSVVDGYSNGTAYGVNSVAGPVWFSPEVNKSFVDRVGEVTHVPKDIQETPLDTSDLYPVAKVIHREWEKAFTRSRDSVINERELIQNERMAYLDKALEVVSQPVNLDAPPPRA